MRSLDDVRVEILTFYHDADLTIVDAVGKAAPFTDLTTEGLETVVLAGLCSLVENDVKNLRRHPVGSDDSSLRAYLGQFQLRPSEKATAKAVYANLSVRFDVGSQNRQVFDFERGDVALVLARLETGRDGLQRRVDFFEWLDSQFKARSRKRVGDFPKHVLVEADKRAGEAFK